MAIFSNFYRVALIASQVKNTLVVHHHTVHRQDLFCNPKQSLLKPTQEGLLIET